ncbi:arsenite efflux transporter metallochaperone ArsD [Sutcliffiella horikoshii]|uniref:arsenite efflux transporter metallochaperone ArsD n=1 Tax=Sutcliffiella horikoshii TaxID=79883 RepID=UPI001EEF50F2|nr:arsenite efflux transporter metallochaperone ArsD [Sutcliffiella horikoshii]MCG1022384.1 arsenic metallochaperone ArsD family protein [Sutcliffiella horikoshii]
MAKIEIFDPAMCCATGVCGPSVDPELTRVASAVFSLQQKGMEIFRYNLGSEPEPFVTNQKVNELLMEKGSECLPVVLVDGEIKKLADYPSNEELAQWTGVNAEELAHEKPKKKLNITLNSIN